MCCYFGAIVKGLDAALYAFHTLDCCYLGEREAWLAGIFSSVTIFLPNHHLRYSSPALSLSAPLHSARVSGFCTFSSFCTFLLGVIVFLSQSTIFLADTFLATLVALDFTLVSQSVVVSN